MNTTRLQVGSLLAMKLWKNGTQQIAYMIILTKPRATGLEPYVVCSAIVFEKIPKIWNQFYVNTDLWSVVL